MKTLIISAILAFAFTVTLWAQNTELSGNDDTFYKQACLTDGFYIIYGNRDGSPMPAAPGDTIEIPVWGATPQGDFIDSVNFMHDPLSSNDSFVTARLGANFPAYPVRRWDDLAVLDPSPDTVDGWTNQSMWGMAYDTDPYYPEDLLCTNGDTIFLFNFLVQVTSDMSFIGDTIAPFREGYDSRSRGLIWVMFDGNTAVIPIATYPRFIFTGFQTCDYMPGDINGDAQQSGLDIIYGINYFKGRQAPPTDCGTPAGPCMEASPFFAAGDVNGDCEFNGMDLQYYIRYLKGQNPLLLHCPYCPPTNYSITKERR